MKDIVSLRNHLFDQLNRLSEASAEELDGEVTRAASIVQVSEAIIKTAQVENQFISITKGIGSGFIPLADIGRKGLIDLVKEKIEQQEKLKNSNDEEAGLVSYGNRTISKETLGNHTAISANKDI